MRKGFSAAAAVAGVVGSPISHSLSPLLHNSWIEALGLDAVYVPFSPTVDGFEAFIQGLRGGVIRGLNITLPFKEAALALAEERTPLATASGAANLLLFREDGRIEANNTDGAGLLYAFARQVPDHDLAAAPLVILGAGGAARGAVAALRTHGVRDIRIVNRTLGRAEILADGVAGVSAWGLETMTEAMLGVGTLINATSAELSGDGFEIDWSALAPGAAVMDMLYRPLQTGLLKAAARSGLQTVDGLDMLIGQAVPSFEAFFGVAPPQSVDARGLLLEATGFSG
jgi:shikimate dehydrogenase